MLLKTITDYGATPEAITAGLHKIKFEGLSATYQSDAEGNMMHTVSIVQIHDLKQVELEHAQSPFKAQD